MKSQPFDFILPLPDFYDARAKRSCMTCLSWFLILLNKRRIHRQWGLQYR